jgi:chemotaxis protein histidine kinase CheA
MSSVSVSVFDASVYVSEQMNRQLVNVIQDFAYRCVSKCAEHYHFDAEEAYRLLGLGMIKVERKPTKESGMKVAKPKEKVEKSLFPLPYNGEFKEECCYALRQNNGLYTQCTGIRREDGKFCKGCASAMQKTGAETPEYGTIQDRMAVDIFEYVDPKGRKPTAYTKIMKKYKISEEQVLAEAEKVGIIVNKKHFEVSEETKRGRPKIEKEPKEKGAKGRPKKAKKVVDIEGADEEDLFATLLAKANEEEEVLKNDEEDVLKKEEEEEDKEAKLAAEKAELDAKKEAKKKAEKAEKEAKKEADRLAKEAKKKAAEEEKAAKKKAAEEKKKTKSDKTEQKKAVEEKNKAKSDNAQQKKDQDDVEEDEEPDVVKKIEFEGKKYLKSKKTGIIYDYNVYVKEGDQLVVGKWNDATNKIDFKDEEEAEDEEEEEEDYDM